MAEQPWPADTVERVPIADLVPYARNARTHSEAQIAQIAASIREWGWTVPVLIDEDGGIIAGHGRVLAAAKLGLTDVPAMTARGWSEAQKRAYVIADNKLTENGGWDEAVLGAEFRELQGWNFDLALTGFGPDEIAKATFDGEFGPGTADEQGRLDRKAPVRCPECGHEFTPSP
jgi:ParB-like chromosome segregation protein Spo0J